MGQPPLSRAQIVPSRIRQANQQRIFATLSQDWQLEARGNKSFAPGKPQLSSAIRQSSKIFLGSRVTSAPSRFSFPYLKNAYQK